MKLDNIRFSGTVTEAGGTTGDDEQKPGGPETGESDGVPALVLVAAVSASAVPALRRKKIAG